MPILDDDRFLIEDAGVSKKIRADKLKGGLDSTYGNMKLLVNKPDYSSRWVRCSDLQTNLPDDHWMLVERSGVSYKVSGSEVQNYFPSGPAGATGVIQDVHSPGSPTEFSETEFIGNVDATTDAPNVILTFPSAQGFGGFRPGDVVQEGLPASGYGYKYTGFAENIENLGDGNYCTAVVAKLAPGDSETLTTITFTPPIPVNTKVEMAFYNDNSSVNFGVKYGINGILQAFPAFNGSTFPECPTVANSRWNDFGLPSLTDGSGQRILENLVLLSGAGQTARVWALRIDGVLFEGSVVTETKVISVDESVPSITVDGGSWTAGTDKLSTNAPRLTVASLATPNFVDNEAIRMVDTNGDTASYVPVTSAITNINENTKGDLDIQTFGSASSKKEKLATLPRPFKDDRFLLDSELDKNNYFNNNSENEAGGPNIWSWSGAPVGTVLHMHFTQGGSGFGIADVIGVVTEIKYFDQYGNDITNSVNPGLTNGHNNPARIIQFTLGSESGSFKFRAGSYTRIYTQDWYLLSEIGLTFADPCPDLKFFQPGDVVQPGSGYIDNLEWSSGLSASALTNRQNAFDGNPGTAANSGGINRRITWTPTQEMRPYVTGPGEFEAKVFFMGTDSSNSYDGGKLSTNLKSYSPITRDITVTLEAGEYVTSLYGNWQHTYNASIYYIKMNGKYLVDKSLGDSVKVLSRDPATRTMVVDGGIWSDVPSATIPSTNWNQYGGPIIYDADKMTAGDAQYNQALATGLIFEWSSAGFAFPTGCTLGLRYSTNGNGIRITYADSEEVSLTLPPNPANSNLPVNLDLITIAAGKQVRYIALTGGSGSVGLYNFYVHGSDSTLYPLLNNTPITLALENKVTGPSKSGTAKCDGVPANTTLRIKDSNGEWIDNTNRLGENFYVKNGTGRTAFTRYIRSLNLNNLPFVRSAVNVIEPIALDGYYPLYLTPEGADAASASNSHHTHTIYGFEFYMPDGGTLYHGSYNQTATTPAPTTPEEDDSSSSGSSY